MISFETEGASQRLLGHRHVCAWLQYYMSVLKVGNTPRFCAALIKFVALYYQNVKKKNWSKNAPIHWSWRCRPTSFTLISFHYVKYKISSHLKRCKACFTQKQHNGYFSVARSKPYNQSDAEIQIYPYTFLHFVLWIITIIWNNLLISHTNSLIYFTSVE